MIKMEKIVCPFDKALCVKDKCAIYVNDRCAIACLSVVLDPEVKQALGSVKRY